MRKKKISSDVMDSKDFIQKITHENLQNIVVKYAKAHRWRCQHWWKSWHSPKGFPDLFMAREKPDGSFEVVVAELKTDKDKPTPEQTEWLEILSRVPGIKSYLWYYKDWDEIVKVLE